MLVDPYNDFLSEGGKLWPMVEGGAKEEGLLYPKLFSSHVEMFLDGQA